MSISPELKKAMSSASGSSTASERSLNLLLATLIRKTPAKEVFEATFKVWDEELASSNGGDAKAERLVGISEFLGRALRQSDREAISATYKLVYRFLLKALDLRRTSLTKGGEEQLSSAEIGRIESSLVGSAFMRMVLKLNEASFRPLFMRMFDWAVLDLVDDNEDDEEEADGIAARQIVLFKTFNALSETLRSLVSSYYAVLLDQVIELLNTWSKAGRSSASSQALQKELWSQVIRSVHLSAKNDEGIFWNPTALLR